MAAAGGNEPDAVTLLRNDTSHGVTGNHGGHETIRPMDGRAARLTLAS